MNYTHEKRFFSTPFPTWNPHRTCGIHRNMRNSQKARGMRLPAWNSRKSVEFTGKTLNTPPAEIRLFGNNFRSALVIWEKRRGYLRTNHTKPLPAGFGDSMRRSRAIKEKICLFVRFFTCSQNIKNNAILVVVGKVKAQG